VTTAFLPISTALLATGFDVRFRASGGSMYPTIRDGELITVRPIDAANVRRGDILLVHSGRLVAHRVTAIAWPAHGGPRFTLRGDDAASPDAPIGAGAILGRVVAVDRAGRKVRLGRWRPSAVRLIHRFLVRLTLGFRSARVGD